jgi:hypothetical protein
MVLSLTGNHCLRDQNWSIRQCLHLLSHYMNKKILNFFLVIFTLFVFFTPIIVSATVDIFGIRTIEDETHLTNEDPRALSVRIINIALSFLGIIAVIIILFGGFKWMTAGGNQEEVGKAKKILIAGLIGLIVILLSWGVSSWVITEVSDTTN